MRLSIFALVIIFVLFFMMGCARSLVAPESQLPEPNLQAPASQPESSLKGPESTDNMPTQQAVTAYPQANSVTSDNTPIPAPILKDGSAKSITRDIKINNIVFKGLETKGESDEYVEIQNWGKEPMDLTGWILINITKGYPSFKFPSYVLESLNTIRVYANEIHTEWGGFSFGYNQPIWSNADPDTAVLYNAQGQEVSRKSY